MNGADNSWFSERTKTWIVSITMGLIFVGMFGGYWAAQNWKAEREQQKQWELEQRIILEGLHDDGDNSE